MPGSFRDDLDAAEADELAEAEAVAEARRETGRLRKQLEQTTAERDGLRQLLDLHDAVSAAKPRPPRWLAPKKTQKGHRATLCALLSDTHFDEVVVPERMGGVNAYNRDIAVIRLRRWAERLVMLSRDYSSGVGFDGLVLFMGGDIFSGEIHEELRRENADTILGSVLFWQEQLQAAIGMLADQFGKVHVPCTFGNHGRNTEKPLKSLEARTNFDWFLCKQLERSITDDRVTFDVPETRDTYVQVYDTVHCLNHGNETSGGSGIGGIWPPIMRMRARKAERDAALGRRSDVLIIGHWHQEIFAPQQGLIVNPSMKGYDSFAASHNFRPERPAQLAWIVTPEHGITDGRPVICSDRKAEGW